MICINLHQSEEKLSLKNINNVYDLCHSWLLFKMIELTKNISQKDDQPFTESLNRFRTTSQTEGDIQCIQGLCILKILITQYPLFCIFGTVFLYFLFIFHIPKLFFLHEYFFSAGSIAL